MIRIGKRILVACFIAAVNSTVWAQTATPTSRGELLYTTHCISCHTTEVHWRQQKLATDWASLRHQVHRWSGNAGLGWSDDDIAEVARYLNAAYYRFEAPSVTGRGRHEFTRRIALTD